MSNLKEFYNTNKDFKDFCDKSLRNGEAESLDVLLTHKIVQNVAEYYKTKESWNDRNSKKWNWIVT